MEHAIQIKRVYLPTDPTDGHRILVDKLWPQGESKQKAQIEMWDKEMAPSDDLRQSLHHEQITFEEFASGYEHELNANPHKEDFLTHCRQMIKTGNVTLLYGSKDELHNNAVVLKQWLDGHIRS